MRYRANMGVLEVLEDILLKLLVAFLFFCGQQKTKDSDLSRNLGRTQTSAGEKKSRNPNPIKGRTQDEKRNRTESDRGQTDTEHGRNTDAIYMK